MNRRLGFLLCATLSIIFYSCVKNETEKTGTHGDEKYFPLKIGQIREYQVDSVLFRQGKLLDSTRSYVKEEIINVIKDTLGDEYILLKSYRKKLTDIWKPLASYTARLVQGKAVRNEGNIHFISLVFPFSDQLTWNGLALLKEDQEFNVAGESVQIFQGWEPFKIINLPKAEQIGSFNLNEVITVLQTDEEDILNKRYSVEKYAKDIGLVYKSMTILDCNSLINNCSSSMPWSKKTTKGFILSQTLINFN